MAHVLKCDLNLGKQQTHKHLERLLGFKFLYVDYSFISKIFITAKEKKFLRSIACS